MDLGLSNTLLAGDPRLIDHIVGEVKSQGIFDQFRKECIADVDTKPAYQNLHTRVEGSVNSFLSKQSWKPDLNKNQLRETLRKHIHEAPYLDAGVERIVDQVVNPKVYSVFMPQIEDVVYKFLGLEKPKPKEKTGLCGLKDLLPKDLDPVSPESDKNSLKDVSLESVDGIDELDLKKSQIPTEERIMQSVENQTEVAKDMNQENGQISSEEKLDESSKSVNKNDNNLNTNIATKLDEKTEEEEEDSPTFEPIDIMNLNESNISNDSHLSGISELTSHRSRSPDISNDLSRDNFDYSNQDSQLSKVSSDSRLSIVTDFGSSNHALTPVHDVWKEDASRDKFDSSRSSKDNFKAIRDETSKNKNTKSMFELNKSNKDVVQDAKDTKDSKSIKSNLSSKENSRDGMESSTKEKYEHKEKIHKEKHKDDYSKSKSGKDKNYVKDTKYYKDGDKKKMSSNTKYDKHGKYKYKEKPEEKVKENSEKIKEPEKIKESEIKDNSRKVKDDIKDSDRKDSVNKEVKDLKDLYKEKIRELREKKELTEKEKLNKDNREIKSSKESKEKRDSSKDKKYKKDHKSSSSSKNSVSSHESKIKTEKLPETKDKKSEQKDKGKRDEKYTMKDNSKDKVDKSKNSTIVKSDSVEKYEKTDLKKIYKNEKEESAKKDNKINDKIVNKKDVKNHVQNKDRSKSDVKSEVKTDTQSKDKKRRDDKKSKSKDDHASLRKNSHDRRSTDRDGSNGSNSKSSQSSTSSSNSSINKTTVSNLTRETSQINNSNSETSDSTEEAQISETKLALSKSLDKTQSEKQSNISEIQSVSNDTNLPFKKRSLITDEASSVSNEIKIKKPKFAKNIHEAKKLMKIRKQLEKQKLKENKILETKKPEKKVEQVLQSSTTTSTNNLEQVPDEERVQIIEVPDEEYEEPYPEKQINLTLEQSSIIMLGESCTNDLLRSQFELKSKLSDMNQSITETICDKTFLDSTNVQQVNQPENAEASLNIEKQPSSLQNSQTLINSSDKCITDTIEQSPELKQENVKISEMKITETVTEIEEPEESLPSASSAKDLVPEASTSGLSPEVFRSNEEQTENIESTDNQEAPSETQQPKASNDTTSSTVNPADELKEGNNLNPSSESDKQSCPMSSNDDQLAIESTSRSNEDRGDCRYFKADNEKSEKFSNFLETLELVENSTLEDIIESLGGQVVSSIPNAMAPPQPKRKHSSSPLSDILLNNSNNNNDGNKQATTMPSENSVHSMKKRRISGPKKQRAQQSLGSQQGLLNGENFVMPLSPESDVSATSEKIPATNAIKEEKSRHRSSQRYSSDDLYKPRLLFSSSSRRSRRFNQA